MRPGGNFEREVLFLESPGRLAHLENYVRVTQTLVESGWKEGFSNLNH